MQPQRASASKSRARIAFGIFALVGAFFLFAEHRAHVLPYLPWILLAACPLTHLFLHHGHGHRDDRADDAAAGTGRSPGRHD